MAIKFHCEHCGKTISAPDDAGGRQGRCPACKQTVYVPAGQAEELELAPLDEDAERRRQRLIEEDLRREHDLLKAQGRREVPPEDLPPETDGGRDAIPGQSGASAGHELRDLIVAYLHRMAGGQLAEAEAIVRQLGADAPSALAAAEQVLNDPMRDGRLADLPPPVVAGFVKQLQHALR